MNFSRIVKTIVPFWAIAAILFLYGCNSTRHVPEGKHLLRANGIKLKSPAHINHKGELEENLLKLAAQKPNDYFFDYGIDGIRLGSPFKLRKYNRKYSRYLRDTTNRKLKDKIELKVSQKKIELPVIYDSLLREKTALNMRTYLFNNGYFYATITDTVKYRNKKAFVTYNVNTGINYLINNVIYDIDDSAATTLVSVYKRETFLVQGANFTYDLLDKERTRIVNVLRDWGFYKITTDNVTFKIDTIRKEYAIDANNAFGKTFDFIGKKQKIKPTLNIKVIIRADDARRENYKRYGIRTITVHPDFKNSRDYTDTATMIHKVFQKINFWYHNYYVREKVITNHMVIAVGRYYSQNEYDQSISKLNELGIFQSVRIVYSEDSIHDYWLNCDVYMTPMDKYDFVTSWELSNGTNYLAGTNLSLRLMNRNVGKGADLFTASLNGGLESYFDSSASKIDILSQNVGFNTSIDFPKFLFPIKQENISSWNSPRTTVGAGINRVDRINYFKLTNYSIYLTYKWQEIKTRMWEVSPAFVNIINATPSDTFRSVLRNNEILANTYKNTFIEGENFAVTITDREIKRGRNYNYLRFGFEEAGALMKGLNILTSSLQDSSYSRYIKFDVDAQRFFNRLHSMFAFRFQTGVGIPYGDLRNNSTLPYIKQYFVGGAYSLRGFRIRTLGPGNSKTIGSSTSNLVIDRTGDIKLELTSEYRFDITKLFGGSIKLNGALFADVGNIWTTNDIGTNSGGKFDIRYINKIADDLAADAGIGIRLDVGFFVVRFDYAMPIKKPLYSDGTGGWIVKDIDHLDEQIFKNDWVLNFAIGYPF